VERDYVNEAYRNALKQSRRLQGVELIESCYLDLEIPQNSLIYCDPPYMNTTGYRNSFTSSIFWHWCRDRAREGHTIFVSEYKAPDYFECVWQAKLTNSVGNNKSLRTEKLFRYRDKDTQSLFNRRRFRKKIVDSG